MLWQSATALHFTGIFLNLGRALDIQQGLVL